MKRAMPFGLSVSLMFHAVAFALVIVASTTDHPANTYIIEVDLVADQPVKRISLTPLAPNVLASPLSLETEILGPQADAKFAGATPNKFEGLAPASPSLPISVASQADYAKFKDAVPRSRPALPRPASAPAAPPMEIAIVPSAVVSPTRAPSPTPPTFSPPGVTSGAKNAEPVYPLLARRRGFEGTLVVRATVAPNGKVVAADLLESSGHRMLDESALTAIGQWYFKPARRDGRPTVGKLDIPIEFRLVDARARVKI